MQQAERRIRHLKLSGPGSGELHQVSYLIEEAFRTASLPGLPPNALILIRHLDLGVVSLNQSRTRLAERISDMVRNLAAEAVCVDEASSSSADLVWFSDPLQPYKVLLLKMLDGELPREWYWSSLFPHRVMTLNRSSIEWLLLTSRQTPLNRLAPAHLLQAALHPGRWLKMLSCISSAFARHMLGEAGEGLEALALDHPEVGRRSGPKPAFMPAPALSPSWQRALKQAVDIWGEKDQRFAWLAWQILVLYQPAWLECPGIMHRIRVAKWLADDSGFEYLPEKDVRDQIPFSEQKKVDGILRAGIPKKQADRGETAPAIIHRGHYRQKASGVYSQNHQDRHGQKASEVNPQPGLQKEGTTQFSPWAGCVLLVGLLNRLDMEKMFRANQELIGLEFVPRLFVAIADRFGVSRDDPLRWMFASWQPVTKDSLGKIHVPDSWWPLTTHSGRPLQQGPGRQVQELINITQLMASIYLRRFCRLSLRSLIRRPGRVVITNTHWDAVFDIDQTDLRLRRMALDCDPGWVGWLGRVVQIHYRSEG